MSNINVEELVDVYLKIRNERDRILREYESKDSELKADMAEVEALIVSGALGTTNSWQEPDAAAIRKAHAEAQRR